LEAQREEATVRREELAIRREELQVQRENQRYAHEYSQQALATQKDDRSDGRKARRGQRRDAYLFSGAVVVVIAVVICYALAQGKDAIATEILQTLTTLVVGAGGGYAVGKSKGQAKAGAGEDDE
jgi:cation transport ATPase